MLSICRQTLVQVSLCSPYLKTALWFFLFSQNRSTNIDTSRLVDGTNSQLPPSPTDLCQNLTTRKARPHSSLLSSTLLFSPLLSSLGAVLTPPLLSWHPSRPAMASPATAGRPIGPRPTARLCAAIRRRSRSQGDSSPVRR